MSATTTAVTILVLAGVLVGAWFYWNWTDGGGSSSQKNALHQNRPPPPRSPSPPRQWSTSTSTPSVIECSSTHARLRQICDKDKLSCSICKQAEARAAITLNCNHTFHDECYSIWHELTLLADENANPCPTCRSALLKKKC